MDTYTSPKIILNAEGVSKSFRREGSSLEVLSDISMSIREGEFVSIVGASGCGKTTLLRILDGLIEPTSGEVSIDGLPAKGPGADRAFVFQQDCLLPWRTVLNNILIGPEIHGWRKAARQTAREYADLVGLRDFVNRYPHELSGGMRQRANLARALTVDPRVLLMDEPFASLDAQTREIMQSELLRIWRQSRKTVIFVTHQIDEALYLSDRVLVMTVRPGRVRREVTVDLPRPRPLSVKRTAAFTEGVAEIWNEIELEVRSSMADEMRSDSRSESFGASVGG